MTEERCKFKPKQFRRNKDKNNRMKFTPLSVCKNEFIVYCPNCGKTIYDDKNFCTCGQFLKYEHKNKRR